MIAQSIESRRHDSLKQQERIGYPCDRDRWTLVMLDLISNDVELLTTKLAVQLQLQVAATLCERLGVHVQDVIVWMLGNPVLQLAKRDGSLLQIFENKKKPAHSA